MKIKSYIKKIKTNPSILVGIVLVLILICTFVLFFEINDSRKVKEEKYDFYYYFISSKTPFEGTLSIDGNDNIVDLKSNEVSLDSTPIYYQDYVGNMILPSNMEIVHPYKKAPMHQLGKYSKIYYKNNSLYINSEAGSGRIYDCFLYDGEDLYVFLEKVVVKIGEETYVLTPLSFIEVTKSYIRIYDFETDKYNLIENYEGKIMAYTDEYFINLSEDTFSYGDSYYMLIKQPDALEFFKF